MTAWPAKSGRCSGKTPVRLVPPKVVEQPLLLDEHPLAVRNVELHAGPIGLRDGVPTRRLQHDGGVEVDQEDAAGPLGGAEDRHRAVDVLRRGPDEVQAFRLPERPDELAFKIVLGSEPFVRPRPSDGRTLYQQNVDIPRRVRDHCLEQLSFAPVSPKVARVEHLLAVGLDEQGVGVERAVIDEIGRDAERPRLPPESCG